MSGAALARPAVVPIAGATSPQAAAAWELALDLFFESWRVSAGWLPSAARPFRQRALTLSRLIGVAALTRCSVVVEVHLSSARLALADLESELARLVSSGAVPRSSLEIWTGWSTRLGVELSCWRLQLVPLAQDVVMAQNHSQTDS